MTLKWNAPATKDLKVSTCQMLTEMDRKLKGMDNFDLEAGTYPMLTGMDRKLKGKDNLLYNRFTFKKK